MGKLIIAKADKTSLEDKIKKVKNLGYLSRNLWGNPNRVCILETEEDYLNFYCTSKNEVETVKNYNEKTGKSIITTYFSSIDFPNYLFVRVLHYNSDSSLEEFYGDGFVSVSVLLDSNTHKTKIKGGQTAELLDFVQLYRYDPCEEHCHVNNLSNIPEEQVGLYTRYFGLKCPAPHFHFASKTNAEMNEEPSSLGINLYKLIAYIEDLMYEENEELNKFSLGLPYLQIKNNPSIYQTTTSSSFLNILERHERFNSKMLEEISSMVYLNKALIANNIAGSMINSTISEFSGLQAVYIDLLILAGFDFGRKSKSPSIDEFLIASKLFAFNNFKNFDENYYINSLSNFTNLVNFCQDDNIKKQLNRDFELGDLFEKTIERFLKENSHKYRPNTTEFKRFTKKEKNNEQLYEK